jgi:hypothetical protein
MSAMPDLDAAAHFLAGHARVLERRRFARLFEGADATPVRDAVAAYANPDGGFGHALEPDGRTPGSQPPAVQLALRTLDECDAWDPALVGGACAWLESRAPAEGGIVGVEPSVDGWPHAPWWQPGPGPSLITTGPIAGTLHARGVEHPWLERATALVWRTAGVLGSINSYEALGLARFLDHAPGGDREGALERLGAAVADGALAKLDPEAPGEGLTPLDYAPRPDSAARALFDAATIEAHLDHLAAAQRHDGGWTFTWPAWSPVAEAEWRGSVTVDALVTLRANGRL